MESQPEQSPGGEQKRYGRNWKKWLLIYAIAGVIVYLIVYFVFFAGDGYGGGGAGGGGTPRYLLLAFPLMRAVTTCSEPTARSPATKPRRSAYPRRPHGLLVVHLL
jgi:hypothetical protein